MGDDFDADRAARTLCKRFGRVAVARLLVAADKEGRAGHLRCKLEYVGRFLQSVDEALRGDYIPPAGHQEKLLPPPGGNERTSLCGDLIELVAGHHSRTARSLHHLPAAAVCRQQDERGRVPMIHNVMHGKHAAVAVSDHDRVRKASLYEPLRREPVVFDALLDSLERTAHGNSAVTGAQDVVSPAVERKAGEAKLYEDRGQETHRSGVEVHRITVEEQHASRSGAPAG